MSFTIYLAGACDSDHEYYCRQWRKDSARKLKGHLKDVEIIDPLQDKDFSVEYGTDEIVLTDFNYVKSSDLILAEMFLTRPYVGTSMELFYAKLENIPIYVATAYGRNYFLDYVADRKFLSIADMIGLVISNFENIRKDEV